MAEAGFFTAKKYEITITPNLNNDTFSVNTRLHVGINGTLEEFDYKLAEDVEIEKVVFWHASVVFRKKPKLMGHPAKINSSGEVHRVTLLNEISAHSIKEAGYIEFDYGGVIRKSEDSKGLYRVDDSVIKTNLKDGNVIALLPILDDSPIPIKLTLLSEDEINVETNLQKVSNEEDDDEDDKRFHHRFSSGDNDLKISDVHFEIRKI